MGEGTYRLTRDLFDYEPLDPVQVKGKAEALPVWVAKAARSRFGTEVQHRPSTPFVGREDELELLKHTFARAAREPSVQLVTLLGEPGVGKSRMLGELFSHLDDQPELVTWRQGRCLPYGEGVTYWALGQIVKAQAGILESDDAGTARAKLSACVEGLVEDGAEHEWLRARLAPLVGLAAPQPDPVEQMESFSAWRRFLEAIASIRPLVIAIEDLHWAQPAMVEFVEHVLEWSAGFPMLIVCTARPEMLQRDPRWGGGMRNSVMVSLAPLSDGETLRLLDHVLRARHRIRRPRPDRRAGRGQPAVRGGVRADARRTTGTGRAPPRPRPCRAARPESLQAIIAARLDTLAPEQKSLVQDASVIGRVFWPSAVAAVGATDPESVRVGLHELAHRELVRPVRVSSIQGDTEYAFAHALIRDVAYGQIPRLARVDKHVAAAQWIERMAAERLVRPRGAARPPLRAGARAQPRGGQRGGRRARGVHAPGPDDGGRERDDPGHLARDGVFRRGPRPPARGPSGARERALLQGGGGQGRRPLRGGRTRLSGGDLGVPRDRRPRRRGSRPHQARERPVGARRARREPRAPRRGGDRSWSPNPPASTSPRASPSWRWPGSSRGRSRRRSTGATAPSSWRPSSRSDGSSRERSATGGSPDASWGTPAASTICGGRSASPRATAARASTRSPCSFAPRWNGRPRDRSSRSRPFARAEISPSVAVSWTWASGSTRSASGRSSTSGRGTSSSRSRTTSSGDRGTPAATTRPGSRSPGSPRSSCGAAGAARPPMRRRNRWSGRRHIRDAQVLVPAEVAAALVAVREGRRAGRDPDRRGARARVGGLVGLVPRELPRGPRPGLRRDRRRAARPATHRRRAGHRAAARPVAALGQGRAGGDARAPRCRGRAVRAGGRGLDPVRPPARDRDRAARCEPLPLRARRPGPHDHDRRAEEIFAALGRLPRSRGTAGGTRR